MKETLSDNWARSNQRHLMAQLAAVRASVVRYIDTDDDKSSVDRDASSDLPPVEEPMDPPAALESLCAAFALSPFEKNLLLLCAGIELDSAFSTLCKAAPGAAHGGLPSFSLALAALPEGHWSAITPAAPLRHWRLIEVGAGESLTSSPLRIDERVLHFLTGISYLDDRLRGLIDVEPAPEELPASHLALAERIISVWTSSKADLLPIVFLGGDESAGKRQLASAVSQSLGMQLRVVKAGDVPASVVEREALSRLWEREAVLDRLVLIVDCEDVELASPALSFLGHTRGCLMAASREPRRLWHRKSVRIDVNRPSATEQRRLWRETIDQIGGRSPSDGNLDTLVSQFDLGPDEIRLASEQALVSEVNGRPSSDDSRSDAEIATRLWDACRSTARRRLDDLAQRIEPVADWNDLVLPQAQLEMLRDITGQVRYRSQVYNTWGFASKGERGLGISALFAGASGTGKTMAAEVLARELRLDLYRIDLSQIVSKFVGDTEKNLRRVFDAAEAGGAILVFDEADALFGKRSEVKDSHDRYANIEISYLLQRMEAYRGLAILTTNMKSVLDTSFMRRIRFIVQFPFPDTALRAEIWRHIFPRETPVEHLDVNKLARLNVAGGNIRNIAMQAAFSAAGSNEPVKMWHLLRAARSEYAKLEKQLTENEVRDWI